MVKGILINRRMEEAAALRSLLKMEHADLIAEMQTIENLPTHERLQLARIRRAQQLKVARQKEKEWLKVERMKGNSLYNTNGGGPVGNGKRLNVKTSGDIVNGIDGRRHIAFENSVVLLEAASRNDMQEVAELLEAGITPDAANEDGLTALHQCCIDNNANMLKLLLEFGANVDAQDSDKWTPLHAAATCGHLELVRILIEHAANLLAVNTDGNMPYDLCDDETTLDYIEAEMSKRGVTQKLIDETRFATEVQMLNDLMEIARLDGDLETSDEQGATHLHIAAANGYVRVVEFLLEMHVNVDAADNDLWTPVHAAACWGHLEVLEMLAQCGADLNVKNKDNEKPSDICEDPEIRERIEQLKTEQESKRLAEAQRKRVRRTQSNNTRAQSVRRTSLRDKTLTSKKDAVEEARLRLQAQEVFTAATGNVTPTDTGTTTVVDTGLEANCLDVGTQATTTLGTSSLMSSSSSYSSTSLDNDVMNHASHVNVAASIATNTTTNNNSNNNNSNNNHTNNPCHNHAYSNHIDNNSNLSQQNNRTIAHFIENGSDISGGNSNLTQNGYGNGNGNDVMEITKDDVDARGGQTQHAYITRRPPDGRDAVDEKYSQHNAYNPLESVQIQSNKEAANGKINVQVTVLVGKCLLSRYTI